MGHHVTGLVARLDALPLLRSVFLDQTWFALAQDFAFLPVDDQNLDALIGLDDGEAIADFVYLTPLLIAFLQGASKDAALLYLETEYHGGIGGQGAAAFHNGELITAPAWREGAINQALALIGVKPRFGQSDAFAAIGLDQHRDNDDIREKAAPI